MNTIWSSSRWCRRIGRSVPTFRRKMLPPFSNWKYLFPLNMKQRIPTEPW